MKRGKLIVIEGIDGSGKGTQYQMLSHYLRKKGYTVERFDFPQYGETFFGKLVGRYLTGEFREDLSPYVASLLYAGDRFEAKEKITQALEQGKIVIANRFVGSNMGHQTGRLPRSEQGKFLDFLETLEYKVFGVPREHLVIFLHIQPEMSFKMISTKRKRGYLRGKARDIHEKELRHQKNASNVYVSLAKRFPYWTKVNCCDKKKKLRDPLEIHKEIIGILKKKKIL